MNSTFFNKIGQENAEDMQVLEALELAHALAEAVQYIELDNNLSEQCGDCFLENWELIPPPLRQSEWQKRDGLIIFNVSCRLLFLSNVSKSIDF